LADHRHALGINAMHLEHALREIKTYRRDCGSPHGGPQITLREGWRVTHVINLVRSESSAGYPEADARSSKVTVGLGLQRFPPRLPERH